MHLSIDFIFNYITLILLFLTIILLIGNNVGVIIGPFNSLATINRLTIITIILGLFLGVIFEGWRLEKFPDALRVSTTILDSVLLATILIFIIGFITRTPISLSITFAGGVLGLSIYRLNPIDTNYLYILIITWMILPIITILLSLIIHTLSTKIIEKTAWRGYGYEKTILLIITLMLTYIFSANTIGLAVSTYRYVYGDGGLQLAIIIFLAIVIGLKFFSGRIAYGIGLNIYNIGPTTLTASLLATSITLEAATLLGIPASISQLLTLSLLGPMLSRGLIRINIRYIRNITIIWIISLVLGIIGSIVLYILFTGL